MALPAFPNRRGILNRQSAKIADGSNGPSGWSDALYKFFTGRTPYGPEIIQVPLGAENDIVQTQLGTMIKWGDRWIPLQQRAPEEPTTIESVGYVQDPSTGQVYQFTAARQNKAAVVDLQKAVIPGKRIVKGGIRGAGSPYGTADIPSANGVYTPAGIRARFGGAP